MTPEEATKYLEGLDDLAKEDDDAYFFAYFSKDSDKYKCFVQNMDRHTAMIVISDLLKKYNLSAAGFLTQQDVSRILENQSQARKSRIIKP